MIYTLIKPGSNYAVEIKVDWLVFKNPTVGEFSDQYSYWDKYCEAKPLKRIVGAETTTLQRRGLGALNPYNNYIKRCSRSQNLQKQSDATTTYRATIDGTIPFALGPGFAFFILNNPTYGDYGVLVISTFNVLDIESWFKNMRLGFTTLMDKGITRLLLDLTANSGGLLCLANILLGVLSPSSTLHSPLLNSLMEPPTDSLKRLANCANEAKIKVSPFIMQSYTNLATRTEFPDEYNWESESEFKPRVVNGLVTSYTKFSTYLVDKCVLKNSTLLADVKPNFKTIILASDGSCGSACSGIITYLQQHGSPAVIISPVDEYTEIPSLNGYVGSQSVSFNNIKDVAKRSSYFDMIPDILENGQMTITYRATFNMEHRNNPSDYYRMSAQHRFNYTKEYADSFASRWKGFFQKGMDIFQEPDTYKLDTSETGPVIPFWSGQIASLISHFC